MLTKKCAAVAILCLCFLAMPSITFAQAGNANGKYQFIMEDELMKYFEFDARTEERGTTTGFLQFTDEAKISFQDLDGAGDKQWEEVAFSMTADFDSMTIEKNRALMGGFVRDSSYRSYIGKWVQLVVEDNDGIEVKDRFVWSVCAPEQGGWIPSDAEVKGDDGAYLSWWATDSERKDDVGIPSPNIIPGYLKSCKVYPLLGYEFAEIVKGEGEIVIRQQ